MPGRNYAADADVDAVPTTTHGGTQIPAQVRGLGPRHGTDSNHYLIPAQHVKRCEASDFMKGYDALYGLGVLLPQRREPLVDSQNFRSGVPFGEGPHRSHGPCTFFAYCFSCATTRACKSNGIGSGAPDRTPPVWEFSGPVDLHAATDQGSFTELEYSRYQNLTTGCRFPATTAFRSPTSFRCNFRGTGNRTGRLPPQSQPPCNRGTCLGTNGYRAASATSCTTFTVCHWPSWHTTPRPWCTTRRLYQPGLSCVNGAS